MAFSETLKYEVKRLAHMSCCVCKSIGVEVHHIIPKSEGGSDEIDNAAPLCPSCHDMYGANPQKRKFIKESRNIWYDICKKRYSSDADRIDQLRKDIKTLSEKLNLNSFSESIAEYLLNKLRESPFFVEKNNDDFSWSIGDIIRFLLNYKEPITEQQIKNLETTYSFLFETKGENDSVDKEYNLVRDDFLISFGKIIARKLTINLIKRFNINWITGVIEDNLIDLLNINFISMIMLLHQEDLKPPQMPLKICFTKNEDLFASLSQQ